MLAGAKVHANLLHRKELGDSYLLERIDINGAKCRVKRIVFEIQKRVLHLEIGDRLAKSSRRTNLENGWSAAHL